MHKVVGSILFGGVLSVVSTALVFAASGKQNTGQQKLPAALPASCHVSSAWCVQSAQKPKRTDYVKNQLLLLYGSDKPANFADKVMKKYHLQERSNSELSSIKQAMIIAGTNGQDPLELVSSINKQQKEIEANEDNIFFTAATARGSGYPLALTGIEAAHKYTKGRGVRIGMIDTPIDITHRSLSNARVQRIELVLSGNSGNQQHGTEVAGVLISQNPRIGIAPEATLLSVSAFRANPKRPQQRSSTGSLVAKALDIIIREKVDVLNLSFAGGKDRLVDKMIKRATNSGIVVVASAGNGGPRAKPAYPAAIPGVIAVTAVDKGERLFGGANRGSYIDLAAPGVDILTTSPRGSFNVSTGTSLATAHVTGVIALLMSMNKQGFRSDVLERTAVDLGRRGRDNDFGHGLVNVDRALNIIRR
ncbi:MAG: S8 family serine peptidase [Thiolinea sp.]